MASEGASGPPAGGEEDLTVFVTQLLGQMQSRFEEMSEQILSKIDQMGDRVGELEKNIEGLMQQAQAMEAASSKDAQTIAAALEQNRPPHDEQ